jgi:hypothetical protein
LRIAADSAASPRIPPHRRGFRRIAADSAASGSVVVMVHYRVRLAPIVLAQLPAEGVRVSVANVGPSLLGGWKRKWAR